VKAAPLAPSAGAHSTGLHPLELLLRPLWQTSIADGAAVPAGEEPCVVCSAGVRSWLDDGERAEVTVAPAGTLNVSFSFGEAYLWYVSERWRATSGNRSLPAPVLEAFYRVKRLIPRRVQLAARRRLIASQGVPDFPAWPLDVSVGRLLRFYAACTLRAAGRTEGRFVWFWPETQRAAVILTHDVETDEGIQLALRLAELEEERGFRSSFNFGGWYRRLDAGVLRELTSRGFEIGLHGLTHDRQLFASRAAFEERLQPLAELAQQLGAVGFRSPATHRVFEWLAELPVEYDCTIANSDPYEPVPGGCCTVWPFFVGEVVELPYTLPQDHTLLTLLGHRSPALWLDQAAAIEQEHGLVQCVSHPDRGYLADADKRAVYAEFLSGLAERTGLWRALPRDAAAWWRRRAVTDAEDSAIRTGTVRLDADATTTSIEPPS